MLAAGIRLARLTAELAFGVSIVDVQTFAFCSSLDEDDFDGETISLPLLFSSGIQKPPEEPIEMSSKTSGT
jgi:hypothetical protein